MVKLPFLIIKCLLSVGLPAAFLIFFSSGCLLDRVLEVKGQLTDFPSHFTVSRDGDLSITLENPVLLEKDIEWLGIRPGAGETINGQKFRKYILEKQETPVAGARAETRSSNHDVSVLARYEKGELREVIIPESLASVIPRSMIPRLASLTAEAKVDFSKRLVRADFDDDKLTSDLPGRIEILKLLGRPTSRKMDENGRTETLRYHYRLKNSAMSWHRPRARFKPVPIEGSGDFTFSGSGELIGLRIEIRDLGTIEVDLGNQKSE